MVSPLQILALLRVSISPLRRTFSFSTNAFAIAPLSAICNTFSNFINSIYSPVISNLSISVV